MIFFSVYTFESHSNELWVMMNSDETVAYSGFLALWEALPLKTCENKTIRGVNSGFVQSPGYPDEESSWFEPPLDCWTFITAPGKSPLLLLRLWVRAQSFNYFMVNLCQDITSFSMCLNGTFPCRNCSVKRLIH